MVNYGQVVLSRWHSGKESSCQCRRPKRCWFDPWVRKIPGVGNGNPLQYSCPDNSTDRGAWPVELVQGFAQLVKTVQFSPINVTCLPRFRDSSALQICLYMRIPLGIPRRHSKCSRKLGLVVTQGHDPRSQCFELVRLLSLLLQDYEEKEKAASVLHLSRSSNSG